MINKLKVTELGEEHFNEIVEIRRHLHSYPELSNQEYNTSKFITEILKEENIHYKTFGETGIAGYIQCKEPSKKIIALRADMDALPVTEKTDLPFKSKNNGIMHACGHDIHMASLLGTARIINHLKEQLTGTVVLIFQPSEEKIPGGAKTMIEQGVLNPKPDIIIGQHISPGLEVGKIALRPGEFMASADEIYITIKGKGGHAAFPQQNIDPVVISSHVILALQQITSRFAKPDIPTILSVGKVQATGATNVIPDFVKMEGSFRTMNEDWRKNAHKKIINICRSITESMNGICEIDIISGYPVLKNDKKITALTKKYAVEFLGSSNVSDAELFLGAEDFSYFLQKVPGVFYLLGGKSKENENPYPLHSPFFNVDESAIKTGMNVMAWITLSFLNKNEK